MIAEKKIMNRDINTGDSSKDKEEIERFEKSALD